MVNKCCATCAFVEVAGDSVTCHRYPPTRESWSDSLLLLLFDGFVWSDDATLSDFCEVSVNNLLQDGIKNLLAIFPEVDPMEWCGEWQPGEQGGANDVQ